MPEQEDIQEEAPQSQAPEVEDLTSPEFDWNKFFGTPATPPVAAAGEEETIEVFEDEAANKLAADVAALRKQNAELSAKQTELERETRVERALEEWRKQASPAEVALSDLLYRSTSVEELKSNEALVKAMASKVESTYKEEVEKQVKAKEREMQTTFGMPVPPTFQPIPRADKAQEAISQGDLDKAAAIMLEGMF